MVIFLSPSKFDFYKLDTVRITPECLSRIGQNYEIMPNRTQELHCFDKHYTVRFPSIRGIRVDKFFFHAIKDDKRPFPYAPT